MHNTLKQSKKAPAEYLSMAKLLKKRDKDLKDFDIMNNENFQDMF